jgi:hypothetical protein
MKITHMLIRRARLAIQQFGPYLALALLPGGSLVALAVWAYRHRPLATVRT